MKYYTVSRKDLKDQNKEIPVFSRGSWFGYIRAQEKTIFKKSNGSPGFKIRKSEKKEESTQLRTSGWVCEEEEETICWMIEVCDQEGQNCESNEECTTFYDEYCWYENDPWPDDPWPQDPDCYDPCDPSCSNYSPDPCTCYGDCGYPDPNPEPAPGERLCSSSFNNIQGGQENSFWQTNVNNLTFENGQYANRFNTYFGLSNGISDAAMQTQQNSAVMGYSDTALGYLQDLFPSLFSNGDIYSNWEGGTKYWYLTKSGAQRIAQWSANQASTSVMISVPNAWMPNNTAAKTTFVNEANYLLRSLLPGSTVSGTVRSGVPNSSATYGVNCQ